MKNASVDAVIFDLGGVLLNLDYHKTINAFRDLGLENVEEKFTQFNQNQLFDDFETGTISPFHFINRVLDQLPKGSNGNQVVHAWNALILNFPESRMNWLEEFGKKYPIYLFSNTNSLHIEGVRRALVAAVGHSNLEAYFKATYLSHEFRMRKPHAASFLALCEREQLTPAKTVFIDDSPQHIVGAKEAGLQAHLLEKGKDIRELIAELGLA